MYSIVFTNSAEKEICNLPLKITNKIVADIENLSSNPRPVNSKKLKGFESLWRIRISNYRVIYSIEDTIKIIEIIRIRHRKDVYKL